MDVVSLEEGKVIIKDDKVVKKSTVSELNNLLNASKMIKGHDICVNGTEREIKVPEVYNFIDNKIIMERCYGDNLEIMLRNYDTHDKGVIFTNQILKEFLKKKFYWKDYAPRNILIDDNNISIMDFERGIDKEDTELTDYFLDSVYEEYGSFLLPEERIFKVEDIFENNHNKIIHIEEINSKRVKNILKKLGYSNNIPLHAYALAVKMIVVNEEPYRDNDDIIYPLIELEDYIAAYGYDKYTDRIIGGYYEKFKSL